MPPYRAHCTERSGRRDVGAPIRYLCPMFLLLLACAGPTNPPPTIADLGPRGDCNPLETGHCLLPFPSSFYLEEDPSRDTGYRVSFGDLSLPIDQFDNTMDPTDWNRLDGFPSLGSLYAHLPGAELDGAATFSAIERSLEADSPTIIVDADTGERVPHYVEREAFPDDVAGRLLIFRPVQPYQHGHRYVVGVRALVDSAGAPAPAAPAFAMLRDQQKTDSADPESADLERQRAGYEEHVFPALTSAGVDRTSLQLAWDFVVASERGSRGPMSRVLEAGLAAVPAAGPAYDIDRISEGDCAAGDAIARKITGELTVPLFLDDKDSGSRAVLDDERLPVQNGEYETPFTVLVPCSVLAADAPARIMSFGHGLFGSHKDVTGYSIGEIIHGSGMIAASTTARGLGIDDIDTIALMMATSPDKFGMIPDNLQQAQLEALLLRAALRGALGDDPALAGSSGSLVSDGPAAYLGISLGSVLGGAQIAMSDDIDRAGLQIPGGPFSLLLARSASFSTFLLMLESKYNDPMDVSLFIPLVQMLWDPAELGGWAHSLPATSDGVERQFLIQDGIGDDTVTSLAAHVYARSAGVGLLEPAVRPVWGLASVEGPAERALVEVDYGHTENPEPLPQGLDPDPHWLLTGEATMIEMMTGFMATGEVMPTCDGPCDPD